MSARGRTRDAPEALLREPGEPMADWSLPESSPDTRRIIYQDRQMQWLMHLALRVAPTDVPVLIMGETGTGKELLARIIHHNSRRAGKPFSPMNCSAVPAALFESELFGHRRGAFTGAVHDRRGVFDVGVGGSVFLDEIAELSIEVQPKLLRVLQEGEVWPIGAETPHPTNVRIIAATNRDIEEHVTSGRFRRDLYFRLSVFPLTVPPLRSRPSDIPLLVDEFAVTYATRFHRTIPTVSVEALDLLQSYSFPGNIRELENLIARAVILLDEGDILRAEHFPSIQHQAPLSISFRERVRDYKIDLIRNAIRHNGSIASAANDLGMSRRNLQKLCSRLCVAQASEHVQERAENVRKDSRRVPKGSPPDRS